MPRIALRFTTALLISFAALTAPAAANASFGQLGKLSLDAWGFGTDLQGNRD